MPRVPEEAMLRIIGGAVERCRRREYIVCLHVALPKYGDKAGEICSLMVESVNRFTIEDFEEEAKEWIRESGAWGYSLDTMVRKLRRWARKGYVVRRVGQGVYELAS